MEDSLLRRHVYRFLRILRYQHPIPVILAVLGLSLFGWSLSRLSFFPSLPAWWKDNHETIVDLLAVLAFVLSFVGGITLELMRRRMATRFIGKFPDHLSQITRTVQSAGVRIDTLADCADYGSFFHPNAHERLIQQIIEARQKRNVEIRVLICHGPKPISNASCWGNKSIHERLGDPRFRECLGYYLDVVKREGSAPKSEGHVGFKKFLGDQHLLTRLMYCHKTNKFSGEDEQILERVLLRRHDWFCERLSTYQTDGAEIRYHSVSSEVFFWVIDGLEAVFLFTYAGNDALAFCTRDPNLISALDDIFSKKWSIADLDHPSSAAANWQAAKETEPGPAVANEH